MEAWAQIKRLENIIEEQKEMSNHMKKQINHFKEEKQLLIETNDEQVKEIIEKMRN